MAKFSVFLYGKQATGRWNLNKKFYNGTITFTSSIFITQYMVRLINRDFACKRIKTCNFSSILPGVETGRKYDKGVLGCKNYLLY